MSIEPRDVVRGLVGGVVPLDDHEAADRAWMLDWIDSGAQLFRLEKPVTPPQHLAVYAALFDECEESLMLINHRLAQAWTFPGGHVDDGEDPRDTVMRELAEELDIKPPFLAVAGDAPLFLTVTQTKPPHSHLDATMWFAFSADSRAPIRPDDREFSDVCWLGLDDDEAWGSRVLDPQMMRFVSKLRSRF